MRLREGLHRPLPVARGALALIVALSAAWAAWQPLRAQTAGDRALALVATGDFAAARAQAQDGQ